MQPLLIYALGDLCMWYVSASLLCYDRDYGAGDIKEAQAPRWRVHRACQADFKKVLGPVRTSAKGPRLHDG